MKKLFFAALVATVAVGGALSTQATTYYGTKPPVGDAEEFDCTATQVACSSITQTLYTSPTVQNDDTRIENNSLLVGSYNP